MSIMIYGYEFQGPYRDLAGLEHAQGIYCILDHRSDGKYYFIDVGESEDVLTRVENHDRSVCWERNRQGSLTVAVLYTRSMNIERRRAIESAVRDQYKPVCGVR